MKACRNSTQEIFIKLNAENVQRAANCSLLPANGQMNEKFHEINSVVITKGVNHLKGHFHLKKCQIRNDCTQT